MSWHVLWRNCFVGWWVSPWRRIHTADLTMVMASPQVEAWTYPIHPYPYLNYHGWLRGIRKWIRINIWSSHVYIYIHTAISAINHPSKPQSHGKSIILWRRAWSKEETTKPCKMADDEPPFTKHSSVGMMPDPQHFTLILFMKIEDPADPLSRYWRFERLRALQLNPSKHTKRKINGLGAPMVSAWLVILTNYPWPLWTKHWIYSALRHWKLIINHHSKSSRVGY